MRTHRFLPLLAAAMLAAGCTKNNEQGAPQGDAVRFTASLRGSQTRSNPEHDADRIASQARNDGGAATRTTNGGDAWSAGDRVGIFMMAAGGTDAGAAIESNHPYSVSATGALSPDGDPMYYPQGGAEVDFVAYYPHGAAASSGTLDLTVDGQSDEQAQDALDVLYARTPGRSKSSDGAVNLQFGHVLSKITFDITLGDGLDALTGEVATAVALAGMPSAATLDLSDGALIPGATGEFAARRAATASSGADATFTALVVPQTGGTRRRATFTVGGDTFSWTIPPGEAFAAGDNYIYPVTVNLTGVTVGAATINPWTPVERGSVTPEIIIAEGTAGPLSWILTPDGTLTISGQGEMPDYNNTDNPAPWSAHAAAIRTVIIESGVTSIGNYAFAYCSNLTSVSVPGGVTTFGERAFWECRSLTSVSMTENSPGSIGKQAFQDCTNLTEIIFPEGLVTIEMGAFQGCGNLKNITLPGRMESIAAQGFIGCTNLESVTVLAVEPPRFSTDNFTAVGSDTLYVPVASLQKYRNSPWADVFTTITAVDGIIAEGAAGPLTWVLTGDGTLTFSGEGRMPEYGINNATPWTSHAVKKMVIGDGVESIGDYAFFRCPNLAEIIIPASVTDISTGETTAFLQCNALSTLTVAADNPNYARGPAGELMSKDLKTLYLVPKNITGGYKVVADNVAAFALQGCTTLSLTVAESHSTYAHGPRGELMGKDGNGNKTELRWVPDSIMGDYLVPDGTIIITYGATYGLGATHLFIPASVARIEEYTFCSVDNLTDITLMSESPPQLSGGLGMCFWGTDKGNIMLHVPAGKKAAYESAGYVGFREIKEDASYSY